MKNNNGNNGDHNADGPVVIPILNNKGFVFIKPVRVRKGDKIKWKAIDADVELFFPDSNLFGETLGTIRKGKVKELTVQLGARSKKGEIFHYSVYHHGTRDFGQGNSSPAIIIQK